MSVIKRTNIFKDYLYGCFCKQKSVIKNFRELFIRILENSPKLSKILDRMKHYKKMFLMKEFFRKVFSFILFSPKQILSSECKRLRRHWLSVSLLQKVNFAQPSKSLKMLHIWLSTIFYFPLYVYICYLF